MKATVILCLLSSVLALPLFAGKDDVVITFRTQGPDTYGDGTRVLDGECYALVWTPAGATFGGFCADGTAVAPSKVVLKKPLARNGRCPQTKFEIDETYAAANYPGGTWGVYLLDTRRFRTDANGVIQYDAHGRPIVASVGGDALGGYGAVAANMKEKMSNSVPPGQVNSAIRCAAPAKGQHLRIRDVRVVGDEVRLYVAGTLSCMKYKVRRGKGPDKLSVPAGEPARYGRDGEDLYIALPKAGDSGFFGVEGE